MFNFHCQLNPNAPKIKKFKNPETFDFEGELGFNYENNLVKWAQNSFHFDDIFHRKFQIPILVLLKKFRETLFTFNLSNADLPSIWRDFLLKIPNSNFGFIEKISWNFVYI